MAATFRRADPGGDVIARNGAAVRRQLVFLSMPGFAASTCFDTSARRHHGWFDPVRGFRMEPHQAVSKTALRSSASVGGADAAEADSISSGIAWPSTP